MKKINLKKLQQVERGFSNSPISHNTLQTMVDVVLRGHNEYNIDNKLQTSYEIALYSLAELGILVDEEPTKKPELLKS